MQNLLRWHSLARSTHEGFYLFNSLICSWLTFRSTLNWSHAYFCYFFCFWLPLFDCSVTLDWSEVRSYDCGIMKNWNLKNLKGRSSWVVYGAAIEWENKWKTKRSLGCPPAWANLKKSWNFRGCFAGANGHNRATVIWLSRPSSNLGNFLCFFFTSDCLLINSRITLKMVSLIGVIVLLSFLLRNNHGKNSSLIPDVSQKDK